MDPVETTTHTYTVTENTHYVPEFYWLNKHVWLFPYEQVKENPEMYNEEKATITGVRFDPYQTPDESPGNPDGRSVWLTIRYENEMELPPDHPDHARSVDECSSHDGYLTKTRAGYT